ncbi:MAG: hypothetical protein FWF84_04605, partial [Kiritimatiellaeota bacterium]|nr:hypothetical protein [Kiritimatiellota bacterium]
GAETEYVIFGIEARLPRAFVPQGSEVCPANVAVTWGNPETQHRITIQRWGLPSWVLGGQSLEAFWRGTIVGNSVSVHEADALTLAGHPAFHGTFTVPAEKKKWGHPPRPELYGRAELWHDRGEQRLYAVTQIAPEGVSFLDGVRPSAGQ